MGPLIVPIGALLSGVALLLLGVGLLNTILALRSGVEGYSDAMLGLIMSSYFAGFFVGTYLALPLVRRVGHIRAFASCASIVSVCVLLHQLVIDPYAWMLFRVLTGTCLVILYTVIESWLNGQTPPDKRGKVFAIYMTVNLAAMAVAQQLLLLDPGITFILFALASVLVSISLVPVTWTRLQQPVVGPVSSINLRLLVQKAPVAVGGGLLSGLSMGAFWGLTAAYGSRIGLSNAMAASLVACGIVGGALFQFPIGRYSDTHDRRQVLMWISVVAAVASVLMFFSGANLWLLFGLMAAYGAMAFAVYPVAVAHLVDHLEPEDMLSGGSGLLLIHGVGAMLGPLLAGQLMAWTSPSSLLLYWAIVQGALALVAWMYLQVSQAEDPQEHVADFVPMVRTTPAALEMLPADSQSEMFEEQAPVWGSDPAGADSEIADSESAENGEASQRSADVIDLHENRG
ncbi:MFS transporter [Pseudomaricurvus sp. HS19]|uniref:MFS transporter n=1 Tax=Pseudomaricurvus sp. HS19 TaxID=2692626 RepID=UPI00136BD19D|nr:MFS transporter [Pseudomaricurvus sp. HS19]MYM65061.1 MFS transporter [Pseudomaricurvus sp. HS19]